MVTSRETRKVFPLNQLGICSNAQKGGIEMPRRYLPLWMAALFALSIWGLLGVYRPNAAAATDCPNTHIVQRGEWLALIARNYGTTVQQLIRLNPILGWNPNLIWTGMQLCVPTSGGPSEFVLQANYQYLADPDENLSAEGLILEPVNITGMYNKRVRLPIQSGGVEYLYWDEMVKGLDENPVLVVLSTKNPPYKYTAYEIANSNTLKLLPSLQISVTHPISLTDTVPDLPIAQALENEKTKHDE
jgi:LysM repeat protein